MLISINGCLIQSCKGKGPRNLVKIWSFAALLANSPRFWLAGNYEGSGSSSLNKKGEVKMKLYFPADALKSSEEERYSSQIEMS